MTDILILFIWNWKSILLKRKKKPNLLNLHHQAITFFTPRNQEINQNSWSFPRSNNKREINTCVFCGRLSFGRSKTSPLISRATASPLHMKRNDTKVNVETSFSLLDSVLLAQWHPQIHKTFRRRSNRSKSILSSDYQLIV